MPALRKSANEKTKLNLVGEIKKQMYIKGWSAKHLAEILTWNDKQKYSKLLRFLNNPGTIALDDLLIVLDKLGLKIEIK